MLLRGVSDASTGSPPAPAPPGTRLLEGGSLRPPCPLESQRGRRAEVAGLGFATAEHADVFLTRKALGRLLTHLGLSFVHS